MIKIIKGIFYYSGVEYIYRKAKPVTGLPTLPLWLIGIYIAFFGIASQRYENRIDIIENRANSIFTQLGTVARNSALSRIANVQNYPCPVKPQILNPFSVFCSIFTKDVVYPEMVKLLRETIENWKEELKRAQLIEANLVGATLMGANLEGANLLRANLEGASLAKANLKDAYLQGANLQGVSFVGANLKRAELSEANLEGAFLMEAELEGARFVEANLKRASFVKANLVGATLARANLEGANLRGANLKGAYLTIEQLSKVNLLYEAKLDPELMKQVKEKYSHLLEAPYEGQLSLEEKDFEEVKTP